MKRPSLARRFMVASATAAAIGGCAAAIASAWSADLLVSSHEDEALLGAARELADEIYEDDDEVDDDDDERSLDDSLAHELDELDLSGARAVVHERGVAIAGDARVAPIPPGACRSSGTTRACAVAAGGRVLTISVDDPSAREARLLFVWSALIGAGIGALMAALVSAFAARFALRPLAALRDRVRHIDSGAPTAAALSRSETHAEIEDLRAAIAELVERLADALSVARSFAAEAAHELRTPLASLRGELELLAESDRAGDRETLDRLRARVESLGVLVESLLLLARREPLDLDRSDTVDLDDVVTPVLEALSREQRERVGARVATDSLVRGDPALLRAALANAIDNALKYSDGPVRLSIARDEGGLRIDVEDEGPGIAEGERERVFAPFHRSAAARAAKPGHGLGLAIVAHVAHAHGGRAEIVPTDRGARLRISLPRWAARR
jgi:two-component system OmpR family sensor kinase